MRKLPPEFNNKNECVWGARVRQGRPSDVILVYDADPASSRARTALGYAEEIHLDVVAKHDFCDPKI